jgi:DNA-binding GntR family transcriptional regulator
LVTSVPNRGNVVTTISASEAAELYQVRSALEALAGRLFVEQSTDRQRRALRAAFGRLEKAAARRAEVIGPRDAFFAALFDGAGNDTLRSMVSGLQARSSVLRSLSLSATGRGPQIVAELRAVLDAVDAGDAAAAAEACRLHSEQAARNGLAQLEADLAAPAG